MRRLALLLPVFLLSACGTFGGGGGDKKEDEFADAVPVLDPEEQVTADPELAGQPLNIPPAYDNLDWAQVGGEADHALHHVAAPDRLVRAWRTRVVSRKAKGAPITAPPILGPDRLYMIDAVANVTAIDKETGAEIWETTLTPDVRDKSRNRFNIFAKIKPSDLGFGGGAALADGRLFVTSGFGFVAALDAETGQEIWRVETPGPMRNPPLVAEGLVVAVSISNEVLALDQATGEEVWNYQSFEEAARFLASAAPAYAEDSVIVPFSSGEVTSLAARNGRVQWQAVVSRTSRLNALSTLGDIAGSPVVDRGAVFAVSQSGQMAGIDLRTGQTAWEQPVGGFHSPWLAGETLFTISNRGELVALNRQDGRVRWTERLPAYENEKKRKGRITWAGPILAGNKLYITGTTGQMLAVSPQTGEVLDRYKLRGGTTLPPVVAEGVLYVTTGNGYVEAFREDPAAGPAAPAPAGASE